MKITQSLLLMGFILCLAPIAKAQNNEAPELERVEIPCSDGQSQPAMWYAPAGNTPRPLLVGLHTWSNTYVIGKRDPYVDWCIKQGWAFLYPHFRVPNNTPAAMGSNRAVQNIIEAIAWVKKATQIDESRIYLVGVSGGGYMALQMAGKHPEL